MGWETLRCANSLAICRAHHTGVVQKFANVLEFLEKTDQAKYDARFYEFFD